MFFRLPRLRARFPARKTAPLSIPAILLASLLSGPLAPDSAAQNAAIIQPNDAQPNPEEDPYGVYLPTDRTLSRGISRARQRLEDGEYNEALAFLQQLLDRDEDVFVDDGSAPNHLRGLKTTARELIAGLPTAGREMYVLLHTAAARRELKAALASGNRDQLAKLVRRYFLTAPGYEAALLLAQIEFDRGHPLAAAHLYDELLADPTVAAEYEPQLSLLAAVSWRAAGRADQAAETLRALAKKLPNAEVELAGRKLPLPKSGDSDSKLIAWLDESIGQMQAADPAAADWLTVRGDPSRNSTHRGGAPHLSARWESRVVNDPRFENFLTSRREQAKQQGLTAIAAARPIAAGNVVLMRTPQNVVAIDWQTGKRIWETREEESSTRDQYLSDFMTNNDSDDFNNQNHPLEKRVWDDTLIMSLSSDGERAFALSGMSLGNRDDDSAWTVGPGFSGNYDYAVAPTNRLTAYELATEGKLAWEIDGANASGDLSGVFFLGAPVAVDGSLYALAEIRSAIYLLALEPKTGKVLWRQQLAGLEQGITLDPQRRLSAATPSYSSGILVCPTTAGIVVAVDAIRYEFAWVYRYPRQVDSFAGIRPGWQGRADVAVPRGNNHWLDGAAVISDGKVLITPPESADLHCLDLSTGKLLWKKPREKYLYLACVDHGNAVLVGPDTVTALRISDGAPAWTKDFELPSGTMPAGLGYLSEGRYFLPLASGQVIALSTADGTAQTEIDAADDISLGNLICHRGSIISQSALFLDKFEQIEVLRERAKAALAANPKDAAAIRDLAEMRRLEGALDEAVPMLKQAYEIDPSDLLTRDMLADALLAALAGNYKTYQADLPLLRKIVEDPQQKIELLRIDAQGLDAGGERLQAFETYLELVDATAAELTPLTISPEFTARSDGWVRSKLGGLWKTATPGEREEISQQLAARTKAWSEKPTVSDLRSYLAYFGSIPGSDKVRQQLVGLLLERDEPLEVEMELLSLQNSADEGAQTTAAIQFTKWLLDQGRVDEAAELASSIEPLAASATRVDGRTAAEWLKQWETQFSAAQSLSTNHGRATVENLPTSTANRPEATRRAQAEYQLGLRRLRLEQTNGPAFGPVQWLIASDGSRLIGRDAAGKDSFRYSPSRRSAMRRFTGNSDLMQAAQLGDLLYVTFGSQVVALDTREHGKENSSDVVWRSNQSSRFPVAATRGSRRNAPFIYHSWSQRRRVPGAAGGMVATLGPVTSQGVIYQDQQRLHSVDPLSGETLWSRSDVAPGSELFGDEEFLLVADPGEKTLDILAISDGERIERRELPETPWLLTARRNIAQLLDTKSGDAPRKSLRIIDAVSGETRFEAALDPAVRMATIEPNLIAVVEPSGDFQLIDVRLGERLISEKLPVTTPPRSINVLRNGDQLFLCVNGNPSQQSIRSIGLDYPLVDGQVFAFDLKDGKMMWPGPAVIDSRGLALTQPADLPVLVFVDRLVKRDASGSGNKLRLLCIDRLTGATVYRNDDLPDTSGGQFRIRSTRGETTKVEIEMTSNTIRLTFTDEPRSPEPPANDLVEAPRKSLGRGLWGVTRRMGSVLQDAIQKSSNSDPFGQGDAEGTEDDD